MRKLELRKDLMLAEELNALLELLSNSDRWCQHAEATDAAGTPVRYNDPEAAAWDLTGALCFLFGWQRACALFRQIDKYLQKDRSTHWRVEDVHIEAMLALQEINDRADTTAEWLVSRLEKMSVSEQPVRTVQRNLAGCQVASDPERNVEKSFDPGS